MSWIDEVLHATSKAESPKSFIYWSALAALASVSVKNVYIDKDGIYKLYPNIYVMLTAESGSRKGFPVWLSTSLVRKVDNTRVISGRNSIEGIMTKLSKAYTREGKQMINDARAFIVSSEFHVLLLENDSAYSILTDWYDTHSNELWENTLKSLGTETLKNVCITMLGASNEANLRKALPTHAIEGGFVGRFLTVPDDGSGHINSLLRKTGNKVDIDKLAVWLKQVSEIQGEFRIEEGGIEAFDIWYHALRQSKRKDKSGVLNRLHDQALKVAMLLSLSERLDLVITEAHINKAIDSVEKLAVKSRNMTDGTGKSEYAEQTKLVLHELLHADKYTMTRLKLLQKHWGEFDSIALNRIIDTLKDANMIHIGFRENQQAYTVLPHIIEAYSKFESES